MRIRKRQVPFPLSSLSPIPLSDLHLNPSHPPVQHHHHHHHHHVHPQPSDQTNQRPSLPIGNSRLDDDFSAPHDDDDGPQHDVDEKNKACLELMMMSKHEAEDKREIIGEEKKSNDTNILGAQNSTVVLPMSSTTSSPQVGRWCEGERAFPLKKRRGSFGTRSSNKESLLMEKEKEKVVMKTKVNKKCVQQNDSEKSVERETNEGGNDDSSKNNGAKKKGIVRGGAIMEGSRCSRVNGRGWRCCQQTLVGYSLCEHHLGKGRLRSMTSVRTRAIATATTTSTTIAPLNKNIGAIEKVPSTRKLLNNDDYDQDDDDDEEEEEEEKKPLMMTKKRMKLGMVKARSLSSLLGQTDNAIISVAVNNKNNND